MKLKILLLIAVLFSSTNNLHAGLLDEDLNFELDTLIFAGIDKYSNVVNLTPQPPSDNGEIPNISVDNYQDGFMVYHGLDYYLGLGPSGVWYFENVTGVEAELWGYVGLALVKDKNVEFTSFVKEENEIRKVKKEKRIPRNASQLIDWKQGDNVYYHSFGGIAASGKVGAYTFGVGPTFIIAGGWQTYIEKMDDEKVFVSRLKSKVDKVYLSLGNLVTEVQAGYVKELSKGYSYVYDLKDPIAKMAYEDFLGGNLIPTQTLAEEKEGEDASIIHVENVKRIKLKSYRQFSIGIPFINFTSSREKYIEIKHIENLLNGTTRENYFGANVKQKYGRFIHRHKIKRDGFYTGLKIHSGFQDNILPTTKYSGKYNWRYFADHSSSKKLKRALEQLKRRIGLDDQLNVQFPDVKKLKHATISYTLNIPQNYIDHLIQSGDIGQKLKSWKHEATAKLEQYFADKSDRDELCDGELEEKSFRACKQEYRSSVTRNLKKMKKSLDIMREILRKNSFSDEKSRKDFVKAFTNFGRHSTKNRFIFDLVYQDAQKCGLSYEYIIEGKRLSRYVSKKEWSLDETCTFKKANDYAAN